MKKVYKITVLIIVGVILQNVCYSQNAEEWNAQNKLNQINDEIEAAKKDKQTGMILAGSGLGAQLLSLAFIPTYEFSYDNGTYTEDTKGSSALFWGLLLGGSVLQIWGIYKWWDASQTMSQLKAKKYDISLNYQYLSDPENYSLKPVPSLTFKIKI
jgi:hypothetical protein